MRKREQGKYSSHNETEVAIGLKYFHIQCNMFLSTSLLILE